jgi:hypothetical protein
MAEVNVRGIRTGDGAGCARAWLDAARYYVDMEPENFQMPAEAGLADWFDQDHADASRPALRLVATVDGQVAGFVAAVLEAPLPDARWQMVSAVASARIYVSADGCRKIPARGRGHCPDGSRRVLGTRARCSPGCPGHEPA